MMTRATALPLAELLQPVNPDDPAGKNIRYTPEWDVLKEARRSDHQLSVIYDSARGKDADWPLVRSLAISALSTKSKDLQIAVWLTEANARLYGFAGLADALRLIRSLLEQFWE